MIEQNKLTRRFHFWFNAVMITLYTLVGLLFLFILQFDSLPRFNTKMIGGVLLLYAIYRGYKLAKAFSAKTHHEGGNANQ